MPGFMTVEQEQEIDAKNKKPFTIKIFGPMAKLHKEQSVQENQITEFAGLSPLNSTPEELTKLRIYNIKFDKDFVEKNYDKGFIRVRVTHFVGKDPAVTADDPNFEPDPNK